MSAFVDAMATSPADDDLYAILGANSSASEDELRALYRKLALKCHPDKANEESRAEAQVMFQRLDTAWKTLGDPELRHQYDIQHRAGQLTRTLVNDDIELEDMVWDEHEGTYNHPCRCGGEYTLSPEHATGDRVVNCSNCSLCIRVAVEESPVQNDQTTSHDADKR